MSAEWRDKVGVPARFRDVPFFVEMAERTGGRRTAKHEFPLRDAPYFEDLGMQSRAYPVEGYVVGPKYLLARDALIAALEKEGPAELHHPHYGRVRVICTKFRVRETSAEGGLARFSIEFDATTAEPVNPTSVPDGPALVKSSAVAARAAAKAAFVAAMQVENEPAFALVSLAAVVDSAVAAVDGSAGQVVSGTQELAELRASSRELRANAAALVRTPAALADSVIDLVSSILPENLLPGLGLAAMSAAYNFTPSTARPAATTSTRETEQSNYDATQTFIQRVLVCQAAIIASVEVFPSYDDAIAVRDDLAGKLDDQAEAADDEAFGPLVRLRTDLTNAVPGSESELARLVEHTPLITRPSLVVTYDLYGSLALEADVLARNRVRRPGFLMGGQALEVLSNE